MKKTSNKKDKSIFLKMDTEKSIMWYFDSIIHICKLKNNFAV